MEELLELSRHTGHPAAMPLQYVGTIIDNAVALLAVPLDGLNPNPQFVIASEDSVWYSLVAAVHRAFLTSLQAAVEKGLGELCNEWQLEVEAGARVRSTALADAITAKVDAERIAQELTELRRMGSTHPAFEDFL